MLQAICQLGAQLEALISGSDDSLHQHILEDPETSIQAEGTAEAVWRKLSRSTSEFSCYNVATATGS